MYPPGGILEMTRDTLVRTRFLVSKCLMHETHVDWLSHISANNLQYLGTFKAFMVSFRC